MHTADDVTSGVTINILWILSIEPFCVILKTTDEQLSIQSATWIEFFTI
jgi:hypothetical protein